MKKTILTFGTLSGIIISIMMIASVAISDSIDFDKGMYIGFASMVLAFLLVFFGIRSYRDNKLDGTISFGKAFQVGILISLISCTFYVISWLIVYYNFIPDFMEKYSAHVIDKLKSSGATTDVIQDKSKELAKLSEMYKNPLVVIAYTFLEPLPVAILITFVSSLILKKKNKPSVSNTLTA